MTGIAVFAEQLPLCGGCSLPMQPGERIEMPPPGTGPADMWHVSCVDGRMRSCCWPDCPSQFDAIAVFGGSARADGWLMKVLSLSYLCPEHAAAGHLPYLVPPRRVRCECGWVSEVDGANLREIRGHWQDPVRSATIRETRIVNRVGR